MTPSDEASPIGWILYDGSCGFCRRWVPFWETALRRRGFAMAALQDDWVEDRIDLTAAELSSDQRLILIDVSLLSGAEVYRYAMCRIWWAWPVYLFSITPGLRQIFDWAYRRFAQNRHRISSACGLK